MKKQLIMKRKIVGLAAGLFMLLGLAGTGVAAETYEITIDRFNFHPPDLLINVGDTVVWENKMTYGHWVISGSDMRHDNRFFSYLLLKGHKFSFTFRQPGAYPYYCPIHSMQAMVTVLAPEGWKEEEKGVGAEDGTPRRRR